MKMIKLVFFVLLLPVVYASCLQLYEHVNTYPKDFRVYSGLGAIVFFLIFFFIYQFWGLYESGQKMKMGLFRFLAPCDKFLCNVLPFHFIAIMLAFYVMRRFLDSFAYDFQFMFFAGFAMAMHIILVAHDLQEQEKSPVKPDYLFTIVLAMIINASLFVLMVDFVRETWTFPMYISRTLSNVGDIYLDLFKMISR